MALTCTPKLPTYPRDRATAKRLQFSRNEMHRIAISFISITLLFLFSDTPAFAQGAGSFSPTGNLAVGRNAHRAVTLDSGNVLVTGGYDGNENALASSELWNPASGLFALTGNLNTARRNFGIALLDSGSVLVAGGLDSRFNTLVGAEIYKPDAGTFASTGNLMIGRADPTATTLNDGTVLLAGGSDAAGNPLASAEVYLPSSGQFAPTGSLNAARSLATATPLSDGTALICGGWASKNALSSCEIYNPGTGSFALTANMSVERVRHTATLLNGGRVLIAGGEDSSGRILSSAELYDPSTAVFVLAGALNNARGDHAATLLTNGTVLVEGGFACNPGNCQASEVDMTSSAEIYDPGTGVFSVTGNLATARQVHTATLLSNGSVLVAGGWDDSNSGLTSAEIYQPGSVTPPNLVAISVSPLASSLTLGDAQRLVAIGTFSDHSMQILSSVVWNSSDSTVATVSNASGSNSSISGDSGNPGVVFAVSPGNATIAACAGSVCASTPVSVASGLSGIALSGLPTVRIINGGETATFVLSLVPPVGFQGNATLSCSGAPQGTECVVSPQTTALNAKTIVTAKVVTVRASEDELRSWNGVSFRGNTFFPALCCLMLGVCMFAKKKHRAGLLFTTFVIGCPLTACERDLSSARLPGTPPGNYSITVTARVGTVASHTQLGLIVN